MAFPQKSRSNSKDALRQSRGGFTLVELLVVIAIIAILASLLMTGLSQARAKADSAVCKNNLRQMGIGMHLYLSDSAGIFPAFNYPELGSTGIWDRYLEPYLGAAKWPSLNLNAAGQILPRGGTFACPGYGRIPGIYTDISDQQWGAYGYNHSGLCPLGPGDFSPAKGLGGNMVSDPKIIIRFIPTFESEVRNPADMLALGDSPLNIFDFDPKAILHGVQVTANNIGSAELEDGINVGVTYPLHERQLNAFRHSARYNMFLADGHVENGSLEKFFQLRRHPERQRRWAADNQPHSELSAKW